MKAFYFFLIVSICISCRAQQSNKIQYQKSDNSLLWEISGNRLSQPSYLFGTFHLMCKEDIRFSENLKKCLTNSQSLFLELDLDDPQNTLGALALMNMKNGRSLKNLYNAEDYERLERFFLDSLQMPLMMLQQMKPVFLTSLLYPKMMNCNSVDGIEQELMILAKKQNKEIKGLETMAFQSAIFDQIPYTTQAKELLNSIDSINEYKQKFIEMQSIYTSQDLQKMELSFADEPGFEEDKAVMLDNRNLDWIKKLEKILKEENIFIAVGAGHLVGKKGLIALLKAKGYTVKPIKN
jgi:uncharacterized protein YbaP (TraB family)